MSSPTWTPAALASEARPLDGVCWRLVEAQHRVSTVKLVDTLDEQALLEQLLEDTKPNLPAECRDLDYLLAAPFRYHAPYPRGSRFRRAGWTPGVFYGAEAVSTAVAELAFYRLLFFAEAPGLPWPVNPAEHTALAAAYATPAGLDLTEPDLNRDHGAWTDLSDYAACQDLADAARLAAIQVLRYRSVRDPDRGDNVALLTCGCFSRRQPVDRRSWRIHLSRSGVQAMCDMPRLRLSFPPGTFADDPRLAGFDWGRADL